MVNKEALSHAVELKFKVAELIDTINYGDHDKVMEVIYECEDIILDCSVTMTQARIDKEKEAKEESQ